MRLSVLLLCILNVRSIVATTIVVDEHESVITCYCPPKNIDLRKVCATEQREDNALYMSIERRRCDAL
jgi:hypothetical protein